VGCLLSAGTWCATRNRLVFGGALLACSTIKPQMALLPLCWFLIWTVGDWRRRWRMLISFLTTLAALAGAGELILPGWVGYFFSGIIAYRKYAPNSSVLQMALGDTLGGIAGVFILIGLLLFAWRNRGEVGDSRQFILIGAAFFMGAILTFPLFTPFNQVLLILPALLVLDGWKNLPRISRYVFISTASWPWIISAGLLLFPPRVNSLNQLPLMPSFLVSFFPLFLPLLLMTRRNKIAEGKFQGIHSTPARP
jgi:hypothetical protein